MKVEDPMKGLRGFITWTRAKITRGQLLDLVIFMRLFPKTSIVLIFFV